MNNVKNLCFAVLILTVLGCGCPKLNELTKQLNTASPSPSPFSTGTPTSAGNTSVNSATIGGLSVEKYNQIATKMARPAVEELLGGKGTEVSSSSGGGQTFTVVKWEGENFKTIIITFQNDKVMSKSQYGLQ